MYFGSLASVHSHMPAKPSRVSASCSTPQLMLFCWLKSASTVLRACCQLFDCPCRIDHVVVDWSCWKLPHWATDRIRFTALTRAFPFSACGPTREDAPRRQAGTCGCGLCICGEPSASQSQWTEIASEAKRLPLQPNCGVRHLCVHVRDSLSYSTRVSREILVATEQLRSLPEGFSSFVSL